MPAAAVAAINGLAKLATGVARTVARSGAQDAHAAGHEKGRTMYLSHGLLLCGGLKAVSLPGGAASVNRSLESFARIVRILPSIQAAWLGGEADAL